MAFITKVQWGRVKTAEEAAATDAYVATQVADGATDGATYQNTNEGGNATTVRIWATADAANAYVNYYNTFTPPPTVAQAL